MNNSTIQARMQRASSLAHQGNLAGAQSVCEEILAEQPLQFDVLHFSGVIALKMNDPARAVELVGRAVMIRPHSAAALADLGNALLAMSQYDAAIERYDRALAINPNDADSHHNRGLALCDLKQYESAVCSYDRAIILRPRYASALNNRGIALVECERQRAAAASSNEPVEAGQNYSSIDHQYLQMALASFNQAIAAQLDYADAYFNRGVLLQELEHLDLAAASYQQALAISPGYAEAECNLGSAWHRLGNLSAALACYDRAIELKADFAAAHYNRSLALLTCGNLDDGWIDYEWRHRVGRELPLEAHFPQPLWRGKEPLRGKTLLLRSEQGMGDTLQFSRYAKLAADQGAHVILEVQRPLAELLAGVAGVMRLTIEGAPLPEHDYHCPLMSLPLAFNTRLASIPACVPYLTADRRKVQAWNEKLGTKVRPRVGLVWSGGYRPNQPELWSVNRRRNIALSRLAPLKKSAAEFYSLQKGEPAQLQLAELSANGWDGPPIKDFTAQLEDFSDTAALIENLDLVISVDTSTAHLAGAMGKPVWLLNRFDTCWRWLLDRSDSPWYPTMRIYRQASAGDWDGVVERVARDLLAFR